MSESVGSFEQQLRDRRKQHNLTQKELGWLIGYARITVRQIELDTYSPTHFVVESVANCLVGELDDQEAIVRFALGQWSTSGLLGRRVGSHQLATPFFGREAELDHIRTLLRNPDC